MKIEKLCIGIGRRLEALAHSRSAGRISEVSFVEQLLKIEAEEVCPAGMTLTASNTLDDWTVVRLRVNILNRLCATFEFLPATGEFRKPGSGPV